MKFIVLVIAGWTKITHKNNELMSSGGFSLLPSLSLYEDDTSHHSADVSVCGPGVYVCPLQLNFVGL